MIEQELVLRAIADAKASALLKEILARSHVPTCLEGELVRAADACSLALPPDCVLRVLEDSDPLKREAAVSLALKSGLTTDHVLPYVTDPNGAVRRKALIRLAKGGESDVRENLLREMMVRPCAEGLDALSDIADDDTVVWFGRVAERHLAWRPKILSILQSIGTLKALRVANNIL